MLTLPLTGRGDTYLAIAGYNHSPGATGQVKSAATAKPKDTKSATSADGPLIQRMVARVKARPQSTRRPSIGSW